MRILYFLLLFFIGKFASSQGVNDTSIFVPMISINYSIQIPGADMAKRFGYNSAIGGNCSIKTSGNWITGLDAQYLFGYNVKEPGVLDNLRSSNGEVIDEFGEFANIALSESGFYFGANFGRMIPALGPNPNSGFVITAGIGYLNHKIKIEIEGNNVPSLQGDYLKGYDRYSNGIAAKGFIGYVYLGKRRMTNFIVGFEYYQAWTQNRREYNFDTRQIDNSPRTDILYSFKFGWILPLYVGKPEKFYIN